MILLPAATTPTVFYFRLFLYELFRDFDVDRKVCIMSDTTVLDFDQAGWYPYATGVNEAVSYNKDVQSSPTYYSGIPKSVISDDIILSRQLIGTKFVLDAKELWPIPKIYPLMTGIVGSVTSDDFSVKLELVSENEKLKSQSIFKVSQDCMNTLGIGKCTVPNPEVRRKVLSLTNRNTFALDSDFTPTFDVNAEYELTIGTTSYLINKSLSTPSNLVIVGNVPGQPQFVKIKKHCNGSLHQCGKYSNLHQFNGCPFLTASVLNVIL